MMHMFHYISGTPRKASIAVYLSPVLKLCLVRAPSILAMFPGKSGGVLASGTSTGSEENPSGRTESTCGTCTSTVGGYGAHIIICLTGTVVGAMLICAGGAIRMVYITGDGGSRLTPVSMIYGSSRSSVAGATDDGGAGLTFDLRSGQSALYAFDYENRHARWLIRYFIKVERSAALHSPTQSLTFVMNAVSQILGHRLLEEPSIFRTLQSASHTFGTPNVGQIRDIVLHRFECGCSSCLKVAGLKCWRGGGVSVRGAVSWCPVLEYLVGTIGRAAVIISSI